jgi:hypothetical protein
MRSATRIAVATALSIASITLAQAQDTGAETRQVVALADASAVRGPAADVPLDSYAGRYVTADGHVLSITIGDDALTLEAPESWGLPVLTLRAEDARNFVAVGADVRVTFTFDAGGEVSAANVYRSAANEAVATTRAPLRGIVTIIDSHEDAVTAALPRGVVTIIDVPDVATTVVASAN